MSAINVTASLIRKVIWKTTCVCVISPEANCDQCGFKAATVLDIGNHLLRAHDNNSELTQCQHCEYKAIDMKKINEHIEADHLAFAFMGHITRLM